MPTPATPPARKRRLAALHAAKRDLGLDDEAYRDMLEEKTGKRSAKDCTDAELDAVLEALRKSGGYKRRGDRVAIDDTDSAQIVMIKTLWLQLADRGAAKSASEAALNAWVKRQVGIDRVHWLTPEAANTVIESLKQWGARLKRY